MNKAVLLGFLLAPIMAIAGESSSVASEGSPQTVIAPEQTAEPAENVEATANATAETPKVADKEEKRICRMEKITGSNMKKRVCQTQAEIEEARQAARMTMEQSNRSTSASFGKN